MNDLESEKAKLKRMYADLALENNATKDVFIRKAGCEAAGRGDPYEGTRRIDLASLPVEEAIADGLVSTTGIGIERDGSVIDVLNEIVARWKVIDVAFLIAPLYAQGILHDELLEEKHTRNCGATVNAVFNGGYVDDWTGAVPEIGQRTEIIHGERV